MNKPLIVLEIANNHQGDIDHGKRIIREFGEVCNKYSDTFEFAVKFQYRDIQTFIHKDYLNSDLKYVRRFLDTQLKEEEWQELLNYAKEFKFKLICTPFDEISVEKVVKDNFDILKIASASFDDWPLVEKIAKTDMEIIASVGGASIEKIKRFYTFMKNREKIFALNYCVSLYPTKYEDLNLAYITYLKKLFPDISIGFSTHEGNENPFTGALAYALGAEIFEKHIALEDKKKNYGINDYSCLPSDLDSWLNELSTSLKIVGSVENRDIVLQEELLALRDLKRGVFAKKDIEKNKILDVEDFYFSIPTTSDQLLANDFSKFNEIRSLEEVSIDNKVSYEKLEIKDKKKDLEIIRDEISMLLSQSNINYLKGKTIEISHHYGLGEFDKYGSTLITLINDKYCKKIIIMLPGQENPEHYHKKKQESFLMVYGDLTVNLENKQHNLEPGNILHIPLTHKHSFRSEKGAVFEEISTTHFSDDSFYTDEKINTNKNRKSYIPLI